MEMLENSNGLAQVKTVPKDNSTNFMDKEAQNGFVDDHKTSNGKSNGDHADNHDDKNVNDEPAMDENKIETNNSDDHDGGMFKENEIQGTKDNVRVEEDMDNSTATSNISDLSAYEDSERSMDVGESKVESGECNKEGDENFESSNSDKTLGNEIVKNASVSGEVTTEKSDEHDTRTTEKVDIDMDDAIKSDLLETKRKDNEDEKSSKSVESVEESMEVKTSMNVDTKISENDNSKEEKPKDDNSDKITLETASKEDSIDSQSSKNSNEKEISEQDKSENSKEVITNENGNSVEEKTDEDLGGDKAEADESNVKSVEKVTDIDGSEILITINEEAEESDNEDNNTKKEKDEKKSNVQESESTKISIEKNVDEGVQKAPTIALKVSTAPITSTINIPQNTVLKSSLTSSVPPSVRFPVMSGPLLHYTLPTSISQNTQQKYINVGGQQLLITLPGLSHSVTPGHTSISFSSSGNTYIGSSPLMNVNMVAATFPPPNLNRKPLDKNLDIDIPQTSWEQLELIKHEIVSRKPDNAFWGGLANVNKKAELGAVSKFLFDLGSDIVKESAYEQIVQVQKKKEDASQLSDNEKESLHRMKKVVQELKDKLKYLHDLPQIKCKCGFKTDSRNVMLLHKQYPHSSKGPDRFTILSCAQCDEHFEGKFAEDLFKTHFSKEHSTVPRIMSKPSYFSCNLCTFEGNTKNSLVKHQLKCVKNYKPHLNLAPHHVDINLVLKNIFYKFQVINKKAQQAHAASVEQPDRGSSSVKSVAPSRPPSQIQPKPITRPAIQVNPNRPIMPTQFQPSIAMPNANQWQGNFGRMLQPTSIIQRPPPPLKPSVNKPTVNQLLKTHPTSSATNRTGFEVCEICGGYVKDRMSLRIHFFYAHKIEMPAHVFSKPLAPLFCNICSERFWTSQGFAKHKTSVKHLNNVHKAQSVTNQCWICHQRPDNLYSHLLKFHRLTTGECMALKRCMFCGLLSSNRKELELHMAASHGVLIKGDEYPTNKTVGQLVAQTKPAAASNVSTKNLSTVVTGGSSGMVRNNFCVFCSAQFADNTKLTLHCLSVHATCKKCGMVVNKSADLVRHVCKMSSKTCNICGMKNLKPAGLIKHLETHTKPCRVAVKRLSPYQIEQASKGKYPRESRGRSRSSNSRDVRSRSRSSYSDDVNREASRRKNPLTVALKFDNGKSKVVVSLDEKDSGSKKEEVLIDSDNDSDVILQEEERTEIVLDSDIEEDAYDKSKVGTKSENEKETESRQETSKNTKESESSDNKQETETSENKKETELPESEKEVKSSEVNEEMETSEIDMKSDQVENKDEVDPDKYTDKLVENKNSGDEEEKEKGENTELETNIDLKNGTDISNDSASIAIETETPNESTSSKNLRKRSHSDIDAGSDVEDDVKKRKTEEESEKS